MWNRLSTLLCVSALCLGLFAIPTRAAETRLWTINVVCDGTTKFLGYSAGGFGANVTRNIHGGAVAVFRPRDGIKFLRLQVKDDPKKIVLVMGFNEVSARADLTDPIPVTTSANGGITMQIVAACNGGSFLQAHFVVYFS
jgi:hypothetical protein